MVLIDPAREADFVRRRGDLVLYRRAFKCSCTMNPGDDPDANRASVNCTVCDGLGFTYGPPTPIIVTIVNITYQKQLLDSGVAAPGDLLMSLSPFESNLVSSYDVINFTYILGEPYEGDTVKRTNPGPDLLSYPPVLVFSCFFIDQSNNYTMVNYQQGVDFVISSRNLTWLPGKGPLVGAPYQIKYNCRYDWEVYVDASVRFEVGHSLGQKAILRKREVPVPIFTGQIGSGISRTQATSRSAATVALTVNRA